MSDTNKTIPVRFWNKQDQPEDFQNNRGGFPLKSSEFKKTYNKIVNPYLKKEGFKTSGFKGIKEDDNFYYIVYWGSGKWGGTGVVAMGIHPKGLPKLYGAKWEKDTHTEIHNYLFTKHLILSNGNEWIDIGIDTEEAEETCNYILSRLEEQLTAYVKSFDNYPADLLKINSNNFETEYQDIYNKFGLRFNSNSKYDAALWLAIIHNANGSVGSELAEIAKSEMLLRTKANGMSPQPEFFNYIERIKNGNLI